MPGGGLLQLVFYGAQNTLLSGNPDMTYFYRVFKKYTHFSLETVSKLMEGNTDYPYDNSVQVRARVDRTGDLASDMYFSFQIPAIYSKFRGDRIADSQSEFQWVRYLGAAAIQSVYITIGPDKVQEFTGEYLMARALIDYPKDKFEKWQQLVGDVPELVNPANGLYGNPVVGGGQYPTVYRDDANSSTGQNNTPSIPSYTVTVPLPFWFTEEGQALPLIGLQQYTVDVYVNLTPSQQLYTVLDPSGYRMNPRYKVLSSEASLQRNIPSFADYVDVSGQIRSFFTDIGYQPKQLNTFTCNPTLHTTYVFLPEKERVLFATKPLTYLCRQVTMVPFPEITSSQLLQLELHNPITRLILVPRRSDSILYRNQMFNVTNWWNYPERPKIPTSQLNNSQFVIETKATGVFVPNAQLDIIQALRVLCDGNEIQELKQTPFYTRLTPFRYLDGGADRKIPVYSFELSSPSYQPSGSINSSRIRRFQIDLQVFPLPPNTTYIYSMNVYVETLNFFVVESGMGQVKYSK